MRMLYTWIVVVAGCCWTVAHGDPVRSIIPVDYEDNESSTPAPLTGRSVDFFAANDDFQAPDSATIIPLDYPDVSAAAAPSSRPAQPTEGEGIAGRIINGTPAPDDEFHFIVSIRRDGDHICGGSMMPDMQSIITAAHCVYDRYGNRVPEGDLTVAVGIRRRTNVPSANLLQVRQAVVHPDYDRERILNDIAILRLKGSAAGKVGVTSVQLPPANAEPDVGTPLHTAGWGRTQEGPYAPSAERLLKTTLKVVDRAKCARALSAGQIPASQICTENAVSGTCNGDSGGPLVNRRKGVDYLVGLTSYGVRGCRLGTADAFTKVSHFTDWIQRVANGEIPGSGSASAPSPWRRPTPAPPAADNDDDGTWGGSFQPGGCGGGFPGMGGSGCGGSSGSGGLENCYMMGLTLVCQTPDGEMHCQPMGDRIRCYLSSSYSSPSSSRLHCFYHGGARYCNAGSRTFRSFVLDEGLKMRLIPIIVVCGCMSLASGGKIPAGTRSLDFFADETATIIPLDYADDTVAGSVSTRIINGEIAPANEFNFMASIRRNGRHVCGGSLMPDLKSIITAAHCVFDKAGDRVPLSELTVAVGIRQRTNVPRSNIIAVQQAVVHPDYDRRRIRNDIAILRLMGSAAGKGAVSSVYLPPANAEPPLGTTLHTAGWGLTEEGLHASEASEQLLKTTLKLVDRATCQRKLNAGKIPRSQICTENEKSGTCKGDSGGPLVNRRDNKDYLVGLTSYGIPGCTRGTADVFTKVSHFTEWIQRVANGETPTGSTAAPHTKARTKRTKARTKRTTTAPVEEEVEHLEEEEDDECCGSSGLEDCYMEGATLVCLSSYGEMRCHEHRDRISCTVSSLYSSLFASERYCFRHAGARYCIAL
ncbi:uncharacterized protein LOC129592998 [Paramacrobiotus metropolitanus]|uniref:uncharacterized protein LOC129592998 n=1 Tax=Paramacrobiotus metropolitanus TaxID=2943436 RepID=UPI002445F7B4|nr:uncharacterized protein LOC129592998 [Paramacrobiotus metropolitanus]